MKILLKLFNWDAIKTVKYIEKDTPVNIPKESIIKSFFVWELYTMYNRAKIIKG